MTNATDLKVRASFTGLIAQFLQSLNQTDKIPNANHPLASMFSQKPILPTTDGAQAASFIKIGSNAAEMQNDFR